MCYCSCCSHERVFLKHSCMCFSFPIGYCHAYEIVLALADASRIKTGEGGWFVIFRLFMFILFFVNWISLNFFQSYKILQYYVYYYCILIRMWKTVGTFFSCMPALLLYSRFSSYLLRLFLFYYLILAVLMRECLGKHLCMSSPFPIAILTGTFYKNSQSRQEIISPYELRI